MSRLLPTFRVFNKSSNLHTSFQRLWAPPGSPKSFSRRASLLSTVSIPGRDRTQEVNAVFLRDSCKCSQCVDKSTQQKLFQTSDIPLDISARSVDSTQDGSVIIKWKNDIPQFSSEHSTIISNKFLNNLAKGFRAQRLASYNDVEYTTWDGAEMGKSAKFIPFDEYMKDDKALFTVLDSLARHGLVFLRDIPDEEFAIEKIISRFGELRNTFYGLTWNVKSVPNAKNVAYTQQYLGYHMDLLYFETPPTIQVLHCLRNSVKGGESFWMDSFRAAHNVYESSKEHFETLKSFPQTFHYDNDGHHYHFSRPTIELDSISTKKEPALRVVNYSPPFQGPFELTESASEKYEEWQKYLHALRSLTGEIFRDDAKFKRLMRPGEAMLFHNRRVLHAREEFDPDSGERWFKGAYCDADPFWSRYRVLARKFKS